MIPLDFVTEFMLQNFENVKITKNGEHFLARCPLCGDSKKSKSKRRFNLEYGNGFPYWKCFNCEQSGNFYDIYGEIKCLSSDQAKEELKSRFLKYNPNNIKTKLMSTVKHVTIDDDKPDFSPLLKNLIDENTKVNGVQQKKFQEYLIKFRKQRNIPDSIKLFVAIDGPYKGRVIIPIFENNEIVYFQARALTEYPSEKYKNPPLKKGNIILNKNKFDRNKYIIVCEGLLDVYSIGDQGTSCLGKIVTEDFINRLFAYTDKGIILALDNDKAGIDSTLNFIKGNPSLSNKLRYFIYPDKKFKDINDLSNSDIINIYDFVVQNSFSKEKWYTTIKLKNGGKRL